MATYAIGDIQGCYRELVELLDRINFNEKKDRLWSTGDTVNRGPDSLAVLRLLRQLDAIVVLGNHDLHLLAVASGKAKAKEKDTLQNILKAPDREPLLAWLKTRPLLHRDRDLACTLIHAGLPPQWNISRAQSLAQEVEQVLQGSEADEYFSHMYGNEPTLWSDDLSGWDRLRFITNCLTRLRFCYPDGRISMKDKGPPGRQAKPLLPWYQIKDRHSREQTILFGHWATIRLGDKQDFKSNNVHALDTGCIWGGKLTAMRLEDEKYFSVPSQQKKYSKY